MRRIGVDRKALPLFPHLRNCDPEPARSLAGCVGAGRSVPHRMRDGYAVVPIPSLPVAEIVPFELAQPSIREAA